jgi:hypothetical protein
MRQLVSILRAKVSPQSDRIAKRFLLLPHAWDTNHALCQLHVGLALVRLMVCIFGIDYADEAQP